MTEFVYVASQLLDKFDTEQYPDVALYKQFGKVFGATWISDRSKTLTMPFSTGIEKVNEFYAFDDFNVSIDEALVNSATDILSRNKTVYLMWSGGIDSTLMIIAFFKTGLDLKNVKVVLNIDSIKENYNFYKKYVLPNFDLVATELLIQDAKSKILDGVIVQAEHADLIFSVSITRIMNKALGPNFMHYPFDRTNTLEFLTKKGWSKLAANCAYDLVSLTATKAPIELKTMQDFAWWYSYNFRWQHNREKFRARINPLNEYITFFAHRDFQRWSVKNLLEHRHLDEKTEFRRAIRDFTLDDNYATFKIKWASQSKHLATNSAFALTLDDKLITNDFNLRDYYTENNSFKDWLDSNKYLIDKE